MRDAYNSIIGSECVLLTKFIPSWSTFQLDNDTFLSRVRVLRRSSETQI
jgi:hypothetical protein